MRPHSSPPIFVFLVVFWFFIISFSHAQTSNSIDVESIASEYILLTGKMKTSKWDGNKLFINLGNSMLDTEESNNSFTTLDGQVVQLKSLMEALNFFSELGYYPIQFQPYNEHDIYAKVTIMLKKKNEKSFPQDLIFDPFRNYAINENKLDLILKHLTEKKE